MNTMRAVLWAVCSAGCVSEYHPEYHPVSVMNVTQVAQALEHPAIVPELHAAHEVVVHEANPLPSYGASDGGADPDYTTLFSRDAGDPFVISERPMYASAGSGIYMGPGVYIGGSVQFHGNVTIHGNVYIDARRTQ